MPLAGQSPAQAGRSPFWEVAPSIAAALVFASAALVWLAVGDLLPGGRWFAVHLLTLGTLTNLILVFSQHFGRTVTRAPDAPWRWGVPTLNGCILAVLVGRLAGLPAVLALGASGATVVVFASYLRLRRMRRSAVGARFSWVARSYERAHGAFIHGAVLGGLLGTGTLAGGWYGAGRIAHLHVQLLGWAGLTLLATLVFFGPSIVRTRIEEGADARAARALRHGATGLTVGVVALLGMGVGGEAGVVLRLIGAAGLGVYAWSVSTVCLPVARAAAHAKASAVRPLVLGTCTWFPLAVWGDVVVVATGRWRLLDALGAALLLGVLVQAVLAALTYLAPMLRGRSFEDRARIADRFSPLARSRTVAFDLGVAAVVGAALTPPTASTLVRLSARLGWVVVGGVVVWHLIAGAWPLERRLGRPVIGT